jgi:high-affinity iron transporter
MLGNYLIGLREGLEAALVVSILVVYLQRTNRNNLIRYVRNGVLLAVAMSIAVAIALESISSELAESIEPIFAGIVSFVAVIFVTWMIFWMKSAARTMSSDLKGKLDAAQVSGGELAVAVMAFVAVLREGVETAIFYWAASQASGSAATSLFGLTLGLATAVLLGWGIYRSSASINLPKFFRTTGVLLIFVAAGVLSYGIHEFQEVALLPGDGNVILNLSTLLPENSLITTLLAGIFNISAKTTLLQAVVYLGFVTTVLFFFLRPVDARPFKREKISEPSLTPK